MASLGTLAVGAHVNPARIAVFLAWALVVTFIVCSLGYSVVETGRGWGLW